MAIQCRNPPSPAVVSHPTPLLDAVTLDPHSDTLVWAVSEQGPTVLDLAGTLLAQLPGSPGDQVNALATLPNGDILVGTLQGVLRQSRNRPQPVRWDGPPHALCLHVDPHGLCAVGTGNGKVWATDAHGRWLSYGAHKGRVVHVARWGDALVSVGSDNVVLVADISRAEAQPLSPPTTPTTALAFADAHTLLTVTTDGTLTAWTLATRSPAWTARVPEGAPKASLAVTDGVVAVAGNDRGVHCFRLHDGAHLGRLPGHTRPVAWVLAHPHRPGALWTFGRDRRWVHVHVSDAAPIPPWSGHTDGIRAIRCADDIAVTAARDGTIRRWSIETGHPIGNPFRVSAGAVQVLAPAPHGDLWFGATDGTVGTLDPNGAVRNRQRIHEGPVTCLAPWTPDLLVSGGADGVLRTWDARSLAPLSARRDHTDRIRCLAVSGPGEALITGSYDGTLLRVHPLEGPVLARFVGHARAVIAVVMLDGHVVSASLDGTLRSWTLDGTPRATVTADPAGVVGLTALGDDGVVSVGKSGAVHVWAGASLAPADQWALDVPLDGLAATRGPHGWVILVGDQRGGLTVFDWTPDRPSPEDETENEHVQ